MNHHSISMQQIDPLGMALLAYHSGHREAQFSIRRDDGFESVVPVRTFFDFSVFPEIESRALALCRGEVLDVGAAAGRHSLELVRRGLVVSSFDILPETRKIMLDRGLKAVMTGDILTWAERSFDTVLMLMNGIGLVGTPKRLDDYLRHAHRLVSPGGQILCDSVNVEVTSNPVHVAYRERNLEQGHYPGQQQFTIRYENITGTSFDWLHMDFDTLSRHSEATGWNCQLIHEEPDGHYLARVVPRE
jgi:SAM-dependent methyltransferase